MKKKILSSVLALCMLLTLLPAAALAAEDTPLLSGNCGEEGNESGVTWALEQNNAHSENPTYKLTISGKGRMKDFLGTKWDSADAPWELYRAQITDLKIGKGVTHIGSFAFTNCINMKYDLTELINKQRATAGEHAFDNCGNVSGNDLYINFNPARSVFAGTAICGTLTFGPDVEYIGPKGSIATEFSGYAFYRCREITTIDMSRADNLKKIGSRSFQGMTGVEEIKWPKNFTLNLQDSESIWSDYIFDGNINMTGLFDDIVIALEDVSTNATSIFSDCTQMTGNISFSKDTTYVSQSAFSGSGATSVTFSEKIKKIGMGAFKDCGNLIAVDATKIKDEIYEKGKQGFGQFVGMAEGSVIYLDTIEQAEKLGRGAPANSKEPYECYSNDRTVLAVANGGVLLQNTEFELGKLAKLIRSGYAFEGWHTKDGAGGDWGEVITEGAALIPGSIYYAKWTEESTIKDVIFNEITFADVEYGYDRPEWQAVSVSGSNAEEVQQVTVDVGSGFEVSAMSDRSGFYLLAPKAGLPAGTYTAILVATIAPEDTDENDYHTYMEVSFTVIPKSIAVKADDLSITAGEVPVFSCTADPLVSGDVWSEEPFYFCEGDGSVSGAYPITPSGAYAGPSYRILYQTGTLTVEERQSGEPSGPIYGKAQVTHNGGGTATAKSDGTVTITPDEGYTITQITLNGKEISIPENGRLTRLKSSDKVVITFAPLVEIKDPKVPLGTPAFADVQAGDWFFDAVVYVSSKGLMRGVSDDAFAPDAPMSRAMLWTTLARLNGQNTAGGVVWYSSAQSWAKEKGISDGLNPDGVITREQLAAMLYRMAGSPQVSGMALSEFPDSEKVSDWAENAVLWAVEQGIIAGKDTGLLDPQGSATRAEAALMLMRGSKAVVA